MMLDNYYGPCLSRSEHSRLLTTGRHRKVDYCGVERLCTKCKEWWPADNEFFASNTNDPGGLMIYCKACEAERKWESRHIKK